jgi:uncharacterized coiled-coil protein SlyX
VTWAILRTEVTRLKLELQDDTIRINELNSVVEDLTSQILKQKEHQDYLLKKIMTNGLDVLELYLLLLLAL